MFDVEHGIPMARTTFLRWDVFTEDYRHLLVASGPVPDKPSAIRIDITQTTITEDMDVVRTVPVTHGIIRFFVYEF